MSHLLNEESQTSEKTIMGPNVLTTTPPLEMGLKENNFYALLSYRYLKLVLMTKQDPCPEVFSRNNLKEAKDHLLDAQVKASEEASRVQSTMTKLEYFEKEIVNLKEQRTSLCANLKGQKQLSHDVQAKVHEIEKDIAALENTTPLNDAIVEDLESSKANLEVLKEDLKSLNPFN
ncbi:UNVERIFIED_CONTAM: hypothetical protein Sangu_2867500 [Sesamum angustifolium]|uniref:Uncharacterized protein n=1 Tax=Sesamum angustifolium TaxID=2727405 RepID=A0AAW2INS5_9LAMI